MMESRLVRFSVFEVDCERRELRKHGIRLKLQDQPFQVLLALVECPGELVTRNELRQRIWGNDTFVDFDQSLNRSVSKLRDALGDGAGTPRFIETVPRRGYRFIAPVERQAPPAPLPSKALPSSSSSPRRLLAATLVFLSVAVAAWWFAHSASVSPPRVMSLTTYTGTETHPAFSPDGRQVAFTWNGEKEDNPDIYVKVPGDAKALRLTSDAAFDGFPSWSPDGSLIAFASNRADGGIYVVSPLGGSERKISDLVTESRPVWSTDGKFLVVAKRYRESGAEHGGGSIFLVPVAQEGTQRECLVPRAGTWYKDPALSPRGDSLAMVFCSGASSGPSCGIHVTAWAPPPSSVTETHPIAPPPNNIAGIAWTKDGTSILFGGPDGLWRAFPNGRAPERLELVSQDAVYPAIDARGSLAFSKLSGGKDADIWRQDARVGRSGPFLTSSRGENSPQYSPAGTRIAFMSSRESDRNSVWVANADASGITRITTGGNHGTPRWSPDGKQLAFDSKAAGGWQIYTVDAGGGSLTQLSRGAGDHVIPSWSRNALFVYFASNRSGRFEIWRVPVAGGEAHQITRNGGYVCFDSDDGNTIYYTLDEAGEQGIFAKRLPDGEEVHLIHDRVSKRGFAVFREGIYYLHSRTKEVAPLNPVLWPLEHGGEGHEVRFYDFARRTSRAEANVDGTLAFGFSVSPNRQTFLLSKVAGKGSDLVLVENFR